MPTVLDSPDLRTAIDLSEDRGSGVTAFDRLGFARRALELIRPRKMRIALCGGSANLRVEVGRAWGQPAGERWAMILVPNTASPRAIALAIAELADHELRPYVLDILLAGEPPSTA